MNFEPRHKQHWGRATEPQSLQDSWSILESYIYVISKEFKPHEDEPEVNLVGYGATSDGYNMVAPSGEGAVRCMQMAMEHVEGSIDYINAHGTSTPAGDVTELKAVREVFGAKMPPIASTKSLTGHSLGATGAQEAIYSLIMMQENFIAASKNVEELDPEAGDGINVVTQRLDNVTLNNVMSNSFGFGGTNATLVFSRFNG